MQIPFKVLFHDDENPMDYRCVQRFIRAFPKSYRNVVEGIIQKSERIDKDAFGRNLAELMPSFRMTRAGAFHGLRINDEGKLVDPNSVIDMCWNTIGVELRELKNYIKANASCPRSRVITDLSLKSRGHIVRVTAGLFRRLNDIHVGEKSRVGPVGATKVLFASLPEVALPVDNLEWKQVFQTDKYEVILSTMADEIIEWEKMVHKSLDALSPFKDTTLPAIYNILAMAARDLTKARW
jgi:hypothetical protein